MQYSQESQQGVLRYSPHESKFGERTSGAVCLCNIYTLPVQDMPPKHWPQSDCLLQRLLQRIIQQWISNVGEEEECDSLPGSRPRLGLGLVFCVLWKEIIYSQPYRHPAMVTCWEAPKKKTMCNIWELLQCCRGNWHNSWPFGKAFSRPQSHFLSLESFFLLAALLNREEAQCNQRKMNRSWSMR